MQEFIRFSQGFFGAIITYCLIAIIEHDLKIGRPVFEVMRILGKSALTTDSIQDLFKPLKETTKPDDGQLYFDFKFESLIV